MKIFIIALLLAIGYAQTDGEYQHYRMRVTRNQAEMGALNWCIEELSFYDMIGHRLVLDKSRGSAESVHGNTFTADKAFNEISDNDDWYYCSEILKKTGWIAYEFQRPVRLSKYVVEALNSNGADFYSPVDWTFEGSMDGTNWVALDEQTGHTLHKDQIYEFPLAPPTPENAVSCDSDIEGETSEDEHNYTYDFTADHTDYVFDTCLTDFDTILHILDSNGNALHFNDDHNGACDFDGNNEYASHLEVQLTPGEQYTLKISGYCASCYGPFTISVGCPGVSQNEEMQSKIEKAAAAFQVVGNTENAVMLFAIIGAVSMMYYGLKRVHKMMFTTSEFQKINDNEIEC